MASAVKKSRASPTAKQRASAPSPANYAGFLFAIREAGWSTHELTTPEDRPTVLQAMVANIGEERYLEWVAQGLADGDIEEEPGVTLHSPEVEEAIKSPADVNPEDVADDGRVFTDEERISPPFDVEDALPDFDSPAETQPETQGDGSGDGTGSTLIPDEETDMPLPENFPRLNGDAVEWFKQVTALTGDHPRLVVMCPKLLRAGGAEGREFSEKELRQAVRETLPVVKEWAARENEKPGGSWCVIRDEQWFAWGGREVKPEACPTSTATASASRVGRFVRVVLHHSRGTDTFFGTEQEADVWLKSQKV